MLDSRTRRRDPGGDESSLATLRWQACRFKVKACRCHDSLVPTTKSDARRNSTIANHAAGEAANTHYPCGPVLKSWQPAAKIAGRDLPPYWAGAHTPHEIADQYPALEQVVADWWGGIDDACKKAFFIAVAVSVLAFGFEMTNLSLHHDDVQQMFIEDTILGHYLGRFGVGWLYYYTQNHYFMPFLQLAEGIVLMSVYGVVVARFWGVRQTIDIALIAAIVCVFPYMAQTYQYNTSMAVNPLAHLLAATAVILAVRATVRNVAFAAALFLAAFSIYQAVAANAATILAIWLLARLLYGGTDAPFFSRGTIRATMGVLLPWWPAALSISDAFR